MKALITKTRPNLLLATLTVSAMVFATAARAQITYVDGDPNTTGSDGNTTINGSLVTFGVNATTSTAQGSTTDGLWHARQRTTQNGGEVWEGGATHEVVPDLITTLTLPAGTYELYGLAWLHNTALYDANFRVGAEGPFTSFDTLNNLNGIQTTANGSEFANPPVLTRDAGFSLYLCPLGQYTVSGSVAIYVNSEVTASAEGRTWYDGVGYALVPEPGACALLGLGGAIMLLWRRRL